MATFVDAVLRQPEILAAIFGYQAGVYADVASRFRDFHLYVDFEPTQGMYEGIYCLDPKLVRTSYRYPYDPDTPPDVLTTETLYLNLHNTRDARFPLHLAILEGDLAATKSILRCRPDLAYQEAIEAAIQHKKLEIAAFLLHQRDAHHVHGLHRNFEDEFQRRPSRRLDDWLPSSRSTLYKNDASILALLWAHRQCDWDDSDLVHTALELNALEALAFLIAHLPRTALRGLLDVVAGNGLLSLVQQLNTMGLACTTRAMDDAAANGHLHIVTYLQQRRTEGCTTQAMDAAAANGHLDVLTFLHEERTEGCSTDAMDRAAANGYLGIVTFLHEMRVEGCTTNAMDAAAANGHLDVVTFLHEKRTEGCTTAALSGAAAAGHLDVVEFLVDHRDEGASPDILDTAAADGRLDIVMYLDTLGRFACTTAAVDDAAKHGHVEVVAYLLAHRREGGSRDGATQGALERGHIAVVERLVAAGYPLPGTTGSILRAIHKPTALALLQLYVAQGVDLPTSWAREVRQYATSDVAQYYFQHAPAAAKHAASRTPISRYNHDLDDIETALWNEDFDEVRELWAQRPELRHDHLLDRLVGNDESPASAIAFLIDAGVGQPRRVAVEHLHRRSFDMMTLLLPYCLHPKDHLDNLAFLVEWMKQAYAFTPSMLLVLKAEMIAQATAANCRHLHVGTVIEAVTEELLETGATTSYVQSTYRGLEQRVLFRSGVADWGLATLVVHGLSVEATKDNTKKLQMWVGWVTNTALKAHLQRLLNEAMPNDLVAELSSMYEYCDY
ncbi:hypothetical protein SDRG_11218 [Saprolegnia diclina VS20]|uniref:Uncharacterized protein n=1 Tax=Saprolegnia diclina (strain VS20) TaxID=1156394 RepID=T0Q8R8_SAPDV|nr:hypothetical protein SDRG_11218 [Saprolegnia diclina VS20]EQC31031.1 hypothetical protein SDRG_11218 [Saprolegnia diclina VS20]|eukprot:XP_008615470.1 hypothetical protein SDRG_11218 [Saprolegnia diclina VS20]